MHYIERSILARMTMELQKWKKNTGNLILVHFEDFIFALNFNFMFSFFPTFNLALWRFMYFVY